MANASIDQIRGEIAPGLASGPLEVVVVGDVTVDQAIADVAATLGALPRRQDVALPASARDGVRFPGPTNGIVTLPHKGRADQAIGYIAWPTTDYWTNPQRARDTAVLREIMKLRLTDQLREAQGATYSPDVNSQHSLVWTGWGYIAATVEVPPEKLPGFFADAEKIAADLRANDVSPDELARAKAPRIESIQRAASPTATGSANSRARRATRVGWTSSATSSPERRR